MTIKQALLRMPVPWVFVLAYLVGARLETLFLRRRFFADVPAAGIAGAALFVAGLIVAGWGWLLFRAAGTTRVPGQSSTTLVTRGPYRFTRNPMYVGLTLAYIGEAGLVRQLWPILLLPLVLIYLNRVVIPIEEDRLLAVFGAPYDAYRARVRRWL